MSDQEKTIFITIAACKEYYLMQTIMSALAAAKNPGRIYFGIFNTILDKKYSLLGNEILQSPNIFYTEFYSPTPMGTGFSRMNAALLFDRKHDYVLQIDAHMIFDKDWDEILINNYNIAKKYTDNPFVLTNMMHSFEYKVEDRDQLYIWKNEWVPFDNVYDYDSKIENTTTHMPSIRTNGIGGNGIFHPWMVGTAWVDGGDWNDKRIEIDGVTFHEGNCVFAALMFYSFEHLMDILHYPKDTFYGDQINFSLRLLSRGFKIFHFYKPVCLVLGKPKPESDPDYHWQANSTRSEYCRYLDGISETHHDEIFSGKYLGYWGAPNKESLEFAKKIMDLEGYRE